MQIRANLKISEMHPKIKRLIRHTLQNKYELRIAEMLGAKLTSGSGAVFSDGDMRVGSYLIEHKARSSKTISLPFRIWKKVKEQALKRDLIPLLILSFIDKTDIILFDCNDLDNIYDYSDISFIDGSTYGTICVPLKDFESPALQIKSYNSQIIPIQKLHIIVNDEPHDQTLYITYLSDFIRHALKLD